MCDPCLVDPCDSHFSFCKACIKKLQNEREKFSLFFQCEECEDAVSVKFQCRCSQEERNLSHLFGKRNNEEVKQDARGYVRNANNAWRGAPQIKPLIRDEDPVLDLRADAEPPPQQRLT